ncbi:MAG: alpha/beta hydrolase [Planctomycetota bacterium]|jgi:esterase/lipase superfamily enzyme|nr:alpha/beta hydrolase [Planctomycetota bacterium]
MRTIAAATFACVVLLIAACGARAGQADIGHSQITVHYGTTRVPSTSTSGHYGTEAGPLRYGSCTVSIPRDHRMGALESPRWPQSPNPDRHVVLLEVDACDALSFAERIQTELQSAEGDGLLFVHGFNVSFTDAARRSAQLSYDLAFRGSSSFFAWPSRASLRPAAYRDDELSVAAAQPSFDRFVNQLSTTIAPRKLHILSHSMGNRLVANYLKDISQERARGIGQVLLTAPDIDAAVFRDQIVPAMLGKGMPVTLYVSDHDRALAISREIHEGAQRAGDARGNVIVNPPMDTIDASDVDTSFIGHSYYGDQRSVLSDMYYLMRFALPPSERHGLQAITDLNGSYWRMAP